MADGTDQVLHFSRFASTLRYEDLPQEVLCVLRRSFLDTIGVSAVGAGTDMARIAARTAPLVFGASPGAQARALMHSTPLSPAGAAMVGAFCVDSVDAHDGTSPCKGHAGSAVFPSILAMSDMNKSIQSTDFANLLAIAYEVSYRAGLAQHATCADYHTSGAWTAIGVATAAAHALGVDADGIRHAAGIAEYHGPRSQMMRCIDHPTMLRDGVGWGAPTGITAAYLAKAGFTGAPALTCEAAPAFWTDLGHGWRLVEDTHYKPYPCCRWAHPAIDAANDLMTQHDLMARDVERVEIRTFHNATRLAGHAPRTADEFAYSIAFPVATMIVRGRIGAKELAPETLDDPEIQRISTATRLIDDPDFTRMSVGKRWAQLSLALKDGRVLKSQPRTPRGDPDDPLSDTEISDKFHMFADPVLGKDRANEIEDLSVRFDTLNDADFRRLLDLILSAPDKTSNKV